MTRRLFAAAAFAAIVSVSPHAQSAPQVLAALPIESGIPLTCQSGICAAQLSTYCLQRERPSPSMGAAYVPATKEHFTLVLRDAAGTEVRVPAGDHMLFTENRGFMSVAASIEHGRMRALGATDARLVVWPGASLIPVPEANDPNPLTDEEIAYVTKSLRPYGEEIVDHSREAATAQLLAKLNAALPAEGALASTSFDNMWQQVIGDDVPLPSSSPALRGAQDAFKDCAVGKTQAMGGFKRCLDFKHDDLIRGLNIEYWENQPGS